MKQLLLILIISSSTFFVWAQETETNHWTINATSALEKNDLKAAQTNLDSAISFVTKHYPESTPNYNLFAGTKFRTARQFEISIQYYESAQKSSLGTKDSVFLVDLYNEKGLWNYDQSRYAMSLLELSKSLEIATLIDDSLGQIISKINIGNVFKDISDYELALSYYQQAFDLGENYPSFTVKCLNNIGTIYLELEKYDLAKKYLTEALAFADDNHFEANRIDAFINLGIIANKENNLIQASDWLEQAINSEEITPLKRLLCLINLYDIAIKTKQIEEIVSLEKEAIQLSKSVQETTSQIEFFEILIPYYKSKGDINGALDFQTKLISIKDKLHADENNIHSQQLKADLVYQEALKQLNILGSELESEVAAKNEISVENEALTQTNLTITILASICILLLISFLFLLWNFYRKSKKFNLDLQEKANTLSTQNEEIINSMDYANSMEKLLIQQMNPHFIFNSLTTIEASISIGEMEYAKQYLQLFSGLLRKTLDYSRSTSIPLIEEIQFLKSYVELNQLNQKDSFECEFIYDDEDVNDFVNTPPMLVQPFIENAILHGLYHKTTGVKKLTIIVVPEADHVSWTITDNGIGRKKAATIKKQHPGVSHGTKITSDRIRWMQNIYKQQLSFEYYDLGEGTKVILKTPIIEQ